MCQILENSLFNKNRNRFKIIEDKVIQFHASYVGNNIVQDDIFHIIENYTSIQGDPLELLRYPINDDELCACTFLRSGHIFVLVNSKLPLAKQIFATAHELYHIYCYYEGENQSYIQSGSILKSSVIDEIASLNEDIEANAFAGLLLVPTQTLLEQIRIHHIENPIEPKDILILMDIFAVPYKAMILRLYEAKIITDLESIKVLLSYDINELIQITNMAKRWQNVPMNVEQFGSLYENMLIDEELEAVDEKRIEEDKKYLKKIKGELK